MSREQRPERRNLLAEIPRMSPLGRWFQMTISYPPPALLPVTDSDHAPLPPGQAMIESPGGMIVALALSGCDPADLTDDAHIGTDALRAAVAIQRARDAGDWPEADRIRALHAGDLTIGNSAGMTVCTNAPAMPRPSLTRRLALIAANTTQPTRSLVQMRRFQRSLAAEDAEPIVRVRPWSPGVDGTPPKRGRRFGRKSRGGQGR